MATTCKQPTGLGNSPNNSLTAHGSLVTATNSCLMVMEKVHPYSDSPQGCQLRVSTTASTAQSLLTSDTGQLSVRAAVSLAEKSQTKLLKNTIKLQTAATHSIHNSYNSLIQTTLVSPCRLRPGTGQRASGPHTPLLPVSPAASQPGTKELDVAS